MEKPMRACEDHCGCFDFTCSSCRSYSGLPHPEKKLSGKEYIITSFPRRDHCTICTPGSVPCIFCQTGTIGSPK